MILNKKPTAFSLADQLEEAGRAAVVKRSGPRKNERVIHYEAADMIRSLAIKLHHARSTISYLKTVIVGLCCVILIILSV